MYSMSLKTYDHSRFTTLTPYYRSLGMSAAIIVVGNDSLPDEGHLLKTVLKYLLFVNTAI